MKIRELIPGIEKNDYYLAEMVGHGYPLNPDLDLSELDDYNLMHFTYGQKCPIEMYEEILRRLERNPMQNYNDIDGMYYDALLNMPNEKMSDDFKNRCVALFYRIEEFYDSIISWKKDRKWEKYLEH